MGVTYEFLIYFNCTLPNGCVLFSTMVSPTNKQRSTNSRLFSNLRVRTFGTQIRANSRLFHPPISTANFSYFAKKKKKEEVFYICTTLVIVRLLQGRQLVNKVGKNKKFHVTCTLRKLNFLPSLCYAAGSLTNKKIFMFLYSVVSSNPSHTRHIGTAMGQL